MKFFIGPSVSWRTHTVSGFVSAMSLRPLLLASLAAGAAFADKPTLVYKNPPPGDDERPVLTEVVVSPQGTDFAFKLEFNREPWGEGCKTRCANATLFLDTDNARTTGLKLADPKAAEAGADLAVVIQGVRELKNGVTTPLLKVKVLQYSEDATTAEEARTLSELTPLADPERVLSTERSVFLLIDINSGNLPMGKQVRVVYHPPGAGPLVGVTRGMLAPGAQRIELFKDGKLTNPVKKKKSDYEKL